MPKRTLNGFVEMWGPTMKRLLDVVIAMMVIAVAWPLFALGILAVAVSSPGPIFFCAVRRGRHNRPFTIYKLRTMHLDAAVGPAITSQNDPRVFTCGRWLRALKIDELPQLVNVIKGDMAIVGPRPEEPKIVDKMYTRQQLETLNVRPGLTGVGSIFFSAFGHHLITEEDAENQYAKNILPVKLAMELVYIQRQSIGYDLRIIWRTVVMLFRQLIGAPLLSYPIELLEASNQLAEKPDWLREIASDGMPVLGSRHANRKLRCRFPASSTETRM
jgi:lipopolysaccharide/colanic/teichoic acid biosynthesis glycosyltransferase